jgi:hypothetical protein
MRLSRRRPCGSRRVATIVEGIMGKGNNSQKNDKKNKKPKQSAKKPAAGSAGKK